MGCLKILVGVVCKGMLLFGYLVIGFCLMALIKSCW